LVRELDGKHDLATMQVALSGHLELVRQCGLPNRARIKLGPEGLELFLPTAVINKICSLRAEKEKHLQKFFQLERREQGYWTRLRLPRKWHDFICVLNGLSILHSVLHPVCKERLGKVKERGKSIK
jgi:hypothetical protein